MELSSVEQRGGEFGEALTQAYHMGRTMGGDAQNSPKNLLSQPFVRLLLLLLPREVFWPVVGGRHVRGGGGGGGGGGGRGHEEEEEEEEEEDAG
jgi:hypothetical protein